MTTEHDEVENKSIKDCFIEKYGQEAFDADVLPYAGWEHFPDLHFKFHYGSFNGHIQMESSFCGKFLQVSGGGWTGKDSLIRLPDEWWTQLRQVMIKLEVFDWQNTYMNHNILDGIQWGLEIKLAEISVKSAGSNDYPDEERLFRPFMAFLEKTIQAPIAPSGLGLSTHFEVPTSPYLLFSTGVFHDRLTIGADHQDRYLYYIRFVPVCSRPFKILEIDSDWWQRLQRLVKQANLPIHSGFKNAPFNLYESVGNIPSTKFKFVFGHLRAIAKVDETNTRYLQNLAPINAFLEETIGEKIDYEPLENQVK